MRKSGNIHIKFGIIVKLICSFYDNKNTSNCGIPSIRHCITQRKSHEVIVCQSVEPCTTLKKVPKALRGNTSREVY